MLFSFCEEEKESTSSSCWELSLFSLLLTFVRVPLDDVFELKALLFFKKFFWCISLLSEFKLFKFLLDVISLVS